MPRRNGDAAAGFALPFVLVVLTVLVLLSTAAVVSTSSELRLGGLQGAATRASLAAEAALEHGVTVFRTRGPEAGDAWPVVGSVEAHEYEVEIRRDTFDFGAGPRPVSHAPGAADGPFNGADDGEPVWLLRAMAARGAYRAAQRLWIVRTAVPRLPAAVASAARGRVRWVGWNVSGRDSDPDGTPLSSSGAGTAGACAGDRAAIHFLDAGAGPAEIPADSLSGDPALAGGAPPYVTYGGTPAWGGAEDILGPGGSEVRARARTGLRHHISRGDSLSGVTWITDRAGAPAACLSRRGCADLGGRGILIVHNPRYDPREHDPEHELYDPLASLDPSRAPARLADVSGGTFRGLVIVDRWPEDASGSVRIHGALVVLAPPSGGEYRAPTGTRVRYSCEALVEAARAAGLGPRRLAWAPE